MKDKESIENRRLQQRVGNFHQYVDSAEIFRPDPVSTQFISEAERFDKDFFDPWEAWKKGLKKIDDDLENVPSENLEVEMY